LLMKEPDEGQWMKRADWRAGPLETDRGEEGASPNYHPWRRFLARTTDLFFFSFFVVVLLASFFGTFFPSMVPGVVRTIRNPLLSGVIVYIFWIPLEALFISRRGATPGKLLFGIRVERGAGGLLSYAEAMQRTFLVWIKGEGLGIPFVTIVTRLLAYRRLVRTGTTLWDADAGTVVRHSEFSTLRTIICAIIITMVFAVSALFSIMGNV